jgi:uncharacterized protein with HEPN domain
VARAQNERLEDLRTAIDRIRRTAAGWDQAAFERADLETLIPISWSFIVIGEAVKALPKDLLERHRAVDWKGFARFRDVLAHQYFLIDPIFLWKAVSVSLPPLDAAVTAELAGTGAAPAEADEG